MKVAIKIFLVIALICSGATIGLILLKVDKRVLEAETARDKNAQDRDTEMAAKVKAEGERDATKAELDSTQASLKNTQMELAAKTQEADSTQQMLQKESQAHAEVKQQYATWRQNHEEFVKLDRTPAQILKTEADLKSTIAQRDTFDKENKLLTLKVSTQDNDIRGLRDRLGLPNPPTLPKGLAGKVRSVDPKYQFVVLDIGDRQGAKVGGEMLANRDGKLVGKVRIAEVATDYSVANVLKDWKVKGEDIIEGDLVLVESNK